MKAVRPTVDCPKCGHQNWDGPKFVVVFIDGSGHLEWTCGVCRYTMTTPTMDEVKDDSLNRR